MSNESHNLANPIYFLYQLEVSNKTAHPRDYVDRSLELGRQTSQGCWMEL